MSPRTRTRSIYWIVHGLSSSIVTTVAVVDVGDPKVQLDVKPEQASSHKGVPVVLRHVFVVQHVIVVELAQWPLGFALSRTDTSAQNVVVALLQFMTSFMPRYAPE